MIIRLAVGAALGASIGLKVGPDYWSGPTKAMLL
jgi:hypothetical protein